MGQHDIDTEFGQKLRDREITPKPGSWEKLNSRLENDTKKSDSYKWVIGIAASLVAGLLILGQVYRTNSIEQTPSVVETPVEFKMEDKKTNSEQNSQLVVEELQKPVLEEKVQNKNALKNTPVAQKETITQKEFEVVTTLEETVIAEIKREEPEEILPAGLEEAIAGVSSNLAENGDLTEAEVDALLMMAAARISREKPVYTEGETVDANSLLSEVEMEMDQSFREKVFDIMKEGYLKARTAVANRNY